MSQVCLIFITDGLLSIQLIPWSFNVLLKGALDHNGWMEKLQVEEKKVNTLKMKQLSQVSVFCVYLKCLFSFFPSLHLLS